MAAPTPTTNTLQTAHKGLLIWNATWANTDNLSTAVVLDKSALPYTNKIGIERIIYETTAGIEFKLYFDDDSADELILDSVLAGTNARDIDFTWGGREPLSYGGLGGSGGTGDVIITTTSAAAGDEILLFVYYTNY